MTDRLRLRISPCPNDTFMFEALLNGRIPTQGLAFEVGFQDIEELNEGVSSPDGPDISKISYAVLPAVVDRYALLDSGSALGRGNGQLLVRRRGDRSPIRRVAIPGELTTANAMLLRFFPSIVDRTPVLFSEIAAAVERGAFDAGVLIHEGRFTYERYNLELVADLGALWERQTDCRGRWAASWRVGNCRRRCVAPSIGYCTTASPTRSNTRRFRGRSSGNTLVSWTTR